MSHATDPAILSIWTSTVLTPIRLTELGLYLLTFGTAVMAFLMAAAIFLLVRSSPGEYLIRTSGSTPWCTKLGMEGDRLSNRTGTLSICRWRSLSRT